MNARLYVLGALLIAGGLLAADYLGDATQTRPDAPRPGMQTEIVFDVDLYRYRQDDLTAAHALWATCTSTVSNRPVVPLERVGPGRFRLVLQPALGEHARERVVGCLRDLTVDRVRGQVVSVTDHRR